MSTYWTIDGFEQLTPKQLVDMSAQHIVAQGTRSYNSVDKICLYDGPEGRTCGAGVFLKPEHRIDADHALETAWCGLQKLGHVPAANASLIQKLQHAHDETIGESEDFITIYKARIRALCEVRRIDVPECCHEE